MKKQSSAGENLQLKVSAQTVTSQSRPHPTPRPMGGEARRLREDLAVGGGAAGVGGRECGEKLGCRMGNEAPLTGRPLGTMCGPLGGRLSSLCLRSDPASPFCLCSLDSSCLGCVKREPLGSVLCS